MRDDERKQLMDADQQFRDDEWKQLMDADRQYFDELLAAGDKATAELATMDVPEGHEPNRELRLQHQDLRAGEARRTAGGDAKERQGAGESWPK